MYVSEAAYWFGLTLLSNLTLLGNTQCKASKLAVPTLYAALRKPFVIQS
jgi:hypothetical protein